MPPTPPTSIISFFAAPCITATLTSTVLNGLELAAGVLGRRPGPCRAAGRAAAVSEVARMPHQGAEQRKHAATYVE